MSVVYNTMNTLHRQLTFTICRSNFLSQVNYGFSFTRLTSHYCKFFKERKSQCKKNGKIFVFKARGVRYKVRLDKVRKHTAVCATSSAPLQELTCHMGSHSVTCLYPSQLRLVLDLTTPEGCKAELT